MFCLLPLLSALTIVPEQISLGDQARVVWVGSTWVEREQNSSHWESSVHSLFPGKKIVWRNLGWSGDNVSGESRAGFGSVEDGYKELIKQVKDAKPNLILVSYGFNEAFEGLKGLENFRAKYTRLLADLKPLAGKIYLTGLQPVVSHPPELVNTDSLESNQKIYSQAIEEIAKSAGVGFLSTKSLVLAKPMLTSNGIHLTPEGYGALTSGWVKMLGFDTNGFTVQLSATSQKAQGALLESKKVGDGGAMSFALRANKLPIGNSPQGELKVTDLAPGIWELKEGKTLIATGTPEKWAQGIPIVLPGDAIQREALRREVVGKNQQFFYRWRPQNETYLFGFRKHEQGNNSREIPQFDPLIEESEKRIFELCQPQSRFLSLTRKD